MLIGDLRAQAIDVVVAAVDAHQFRAKHLRAENLGRLEIGRDKNPCLQAFASRLRGDGEFARFPVEEQATVSNPKLRALASATATTRSLKLKVGRQTASFLIRAGAIRSSRPGAAR
jgi:hypothetical protein